MHTRDVLEREHGAVVIQAAAVMLVLMGFGAFVVDYGILWVSRQQAQHAADAGAMAAAVARAYDDNGDPPSVSGVVGRSASELVALNPVWFAPGEPVISFNCPPEIASGRCVRVDVYRDGTLGSSGLPTVFGPVLGFVEQRVRATATAQVAAGNATTCLKPWAIPDKWVELRPAPSAWPGDGLFEKYEESGPTAGTLLVPADDYAPPDTSGPGSGFTVTGPTDIGLEVTLSFGNPDTSPPIAPDLLLPLDLNGTSSTADYQANIADCYGRVVAVGDAVLTGTPSMQAATTAGFTALIASDSGASWNPVTASIDGSCAPACAPISPRLVVLALFDPDVYQLARATDTWSCPMAGRRCVDVVNLVGVFLDRVEASGDAIGYLARHPGLLSRDHPTLSTVSSFLPAITLVR